MRWMILSVIGALTLASPGWAQIEAEDQLTITAPTGPPLVVFSSEKVENLNADQLDGMEAAAFINELALLQQQLDALNARVGISQKTIFVTSQVFDADLGGIDGAIVKCNEAARSAGLIGFYRPWLATTSGENPAGSMVQASVPYVRTDGVAVADNWADLTDGDLANRIDRDEFANDLSSTLLLASPVWSNVKADGTTLFSSPDFSCLGWTSNVPAATFPLGMIGLFVSAETGYWTASKTNDPTGPGFDFLFCDRQARLYCVQQ